MPPLAPVPNVLRSDLLWTVGSDLGVSTTQYWSYSGGPPSASDALTIAAGIYTAATGFQDSMPTSVTLTGVTVTDLSSSSAAQATHEAAAVGMRSGGLLSGSTAALINFTIARRYRGGKPRNYFPLGTSSDLENEQQWSTAFLTMLTNTWGTYTGSVIGTTGGSTTISSHANVSYYSGSKVVVSPTTGRARNVPLRRDTPQVDTIVGFSWAPRPGNQRKRG